MKNSIYDDIRDGLNSNFPLCCIVYFLVRCKISSRTGYFLRGFHESGKGRHIFCPFHMFRKIKPYYNCPNNACNLYDPNYHGIAVNLKHFQWMQYGKKLCNKCGGKMKKRIYAKLTK